MAASSDTSKPPSSSCQVQLTKTPSSLRSVFVPDPHTDRRRLPLEAQRILCAIEDAILGLELVALIPSMCLQLTELRYMLGPQLSSDISRISNLLGLVGLGRSRSNIDVKMSFSELPSSFVTRPDFCSPSTVKAIQVAIKAAVRQLMMKPKLRTKLIRQTPNSDAMSSLLESFRELLSFVLERLLTSEADERKQMYAVEAMQKRERKYAEDIEQLEAEVDEAKAANVDRLAELKDQLEDLEDEIQNLCSASTETILRKRAETKTLLEIEERNNVRHVTQLEEQYQQLYTKYQQQIVEHRTAEAVLRKKNFKINAEVNNWIRKYDGDMSDRQAAYETLLTEYAHEKAELDAMEEEFIEAEVLYKQIMMERAIREEEERQKREFIARRNHAATIIQAHWRGYLTRKMFKKLKKMMKKRK